MTRAGLPPPVQMSHVARVRETTVVFVITYSMFTGTWRREVATAEAAVVQYNELRAAGAGGIVITDGDGRSYSATELAGSTAVTSTKGALARQTR